MKKFKVILCLLSLTIFVDQLYLPSVESKALLCHSAPKWTVNNGSDPMRESSGNVTLVTLINASFKFGLKQASSLENMLRFLKKSGLKDIHFIAINSKDFDAKRKFKELLLRVSFGVYQENQFELVWDVLDGGRDDMFIYDRCGLLTYYIPFPLSIIHSQQPILQAALLSTYFDNPCGDSCDSLGSDISSTTTSTTTTALPSADTTVTSRPIDLNTTSASNLTFDGLLSEDFNDSLVIELNSTSVDMKEDNVFIYEKTEINESSIVSEDFGGSGSGDGDTDSIIELTTDLNDIPMKSEDNVSANADKEKDKEWKILDFFKPKDNRSDKDIFDEIYNKSIIELQFNETDGQKVTEIGNETQTTTELLPNMNSWNESMETTISPTLESTTSAKKPRISFFTRAKCEAFNQSMCMEWSTDRLLRARLCCLTEVLADDESGFGCGHFQKSKCHQMLPLIKCCLKDFSQLLENYFQSIPVTSRPSQQMRK